MHLYSFRKKERLISKKLINSLFEKGNSFLVYPVKVIFMETESLGDFPVQAAFSVSKRNFRKAVKRNLIKRKMKEAYRKNKSQLISEWKHKKLVVMFIYIAREIIPYAEIEKSIKTILNKLEKNKA